MCFLISLQTSLTRRLFRRILLSFQVFGDFPIIFDFDFIVVRDKFGMSSILLNLLRFTLWPTVWSIIVYAPWVLEKNVYFALVG